MLRAVRPLLVCVTAAVVMLGGALAPASAAVGAEVSRAVTPEDLLPDVQVQPLSDFRVQIIDGRRVLRFTTTIVNRGDGPLELAATRSSTSTPDLSVVQHVYQPDGSYQPRPIPAVLRYSDDSRRTWNLVGAAQFTLTVPGDSAPRVTHSVDLCLTDETRLVGTADARGYGCLAGRADSRSVTEGLSVGWGNSYSAYQRNQWVDLTGLPLPGQYCVAAEADPQHMLSEKSADNNAVSTLVDVSSNGSTVVKANC